MKRYVALLAFFLGLGWAVAQESWKPQSFCPVSGKPINKEVYLDIQGQRIYFCCAKCPAEFQKDPEKHFRWLEKNHVSDMAQRYAMKAKTCLGKVTRISLEWPLWLATGRALVTFADAENATKLYHF